MPIFVRLETLDHKKLDQEVPPRELLNRLLPFGDSSFPLLGAVDPYGNTIFKGLQIPQLMAEWERSKAHLKDEDDRAFSLRLRNMAERCMAEPHTFLRFIGD
ncbi:MAG TPA: hypothetical protein VLL05_05310 [Terriglobales bacterium]|nr:hypothetical protein [Terriglobales bacterium]